MKKRPVKNWKAVNLSGKFFSNKVQDTLKFGVKIAGMLEKGNVIYLKGGLGSGKTVLSKGICRGLKVNGSVTSPSYKLVNIYFGSLPVYHVDLYRLDSTNDIENLGLDEYIYGDGVTIIEWAEKLKKIEKNKGIEIRIKITGDSKRDIKWRRL